jgi:hypothetical protein
MIGWSMSPKHILSIVVTVISLTNVHAWAAEKEDKEPLAIIELGGAGEWGFNGEPIFGPSVAVEFEPIKNWLEIEIGTAPLFNHGHVEWDSDILFKKPFTLSDTVEFMVGAGPHWSQPMNGSAQFGAEFALDFMIWPTRDRRFGWFIEPTYSYSFNGEHEKSLGLSGGLFIPIQP